MPTYQLQSYVYLDSYNECYKKIIIINTMPIGPLQNLIKTLQNKKVSPFKKQFTLLSCTSMYICYTRSTR